MRACKRCLDHYRTLGLPQSATEADIKQAFLKLAKTHHPDVNRGDEAAATFSKIAEAHAILNNKESKLDYDRDISNHRSDGRAQPAKPAQVRKTPSGFKRQPKPGGGPLHDFEEWDAQHHGDKYGNFSRDATEQAPVAETPEQAFYSRKVRSQEDRDATKDIMSQRQEKVNIVDRLAVRRAQRRASAPSHDSPLSCAIC
ncbi:DnaJ domain-containing protein [Pelagophyceae sp. CCMP2097]|nr:DnaJ domain-containing protein [Pelagophyceae sp. CCMP2097]